MLLLALVLAVITAARGQLQDDNYCLARDQYPYLHFGPKTAYERVYDHRDSPQSVPWCYPRGVWLLGRAGASYPDRDTLLRLQEGLYPLREEIVRNHEFNNPKIPAGRHCHPRALWILARPGTRYPSLQLLQRMRTVLPGLRDQIRRNHDDRRSGKLCPEDLAALSRWHLDVPDDKAHWLTGQGQADLSFLAKRLKRRLPEILNATYTPERFKFRFTNSQRTQDSAEAFASGLFENAQIVMPRPLERDPLLEFDKNCPAWEERVHLNPEATIEVLKFEEGPEMQQTLHRVSRRLGFLYNLTLENIDLMYEMCRYDKAWKYIALSPWCAAFTEDDLKVMEYRADLQYYYLYSYGNEINVRLGCPPIKDMFDMFGRMENQGAAYENAYPPSGAFYFTHDSALHMALARLGIARDPEPLLARNFNHQSKRQFRTSFIGSFAANLAAVFYECEHDEKHRVMFYLRERIVEYDGCEVGLCSWSFIKSRLARAVYDCDLRFCDSSSAGGSPATTSVVLASALALLLVHIAQ